MNTAEQNKNSMLEQLTQQAAELQAKIEELNAQPTVYGYARVSSRGQARDGNSLEVQQKALTEAGATELYADVFTGTTTDRPQLELLLQRIKSGDTLMVTKLDRIARSVRQGIGLIEELAQRGVTVHVLNMGRIDNTPTGRLIRNIMLSFAEFERDLIVQRTREGKEASGNYGGRHKKYSPEQLSLAMELLTEHSYSEVVKMTGISKSTLIRERKRREMG